MKNLKWLCFISIVCITNTNFAQLSDLARIDYTILPAGNSNIEYNRVRGLFNYPIKLKKEKTYLLLGIDYSTINLLIKEAPLFDKNALSGFQLLDLNVGYTTPLKNGWRLGVRLKPGFSSNLTANDLGIEDLILSGDVIFIKDKKDSKNVDKPWRLVLGVSYSGNRGFPFPLPFISYYKKFHNKWSYSIGIPKTNLQYLFSNKHRLKLYAEIDGFTANLQRGFTIENASVVESINMSLVLGGLQYEYYITKNIQYYARASYIFSNSVRLRDENRDTILELDNSNTLYLRTGIRFKI